MLKTNFSLYFSNKGWNDWECRTSVQTNQGIILNTLIIGLEYRLIKLLS